MKKNSLFFLFLIIFFSGCSQKKDTVSFEAMNTFMTCTAYGKKSRSVNAAVKKNIINLENKISTTNPDSEVYKLNNDSSFDTISFVTGNLIAYSLEMADKTEGALNPCLYPVTKSWGFTTGVYQVPSQEQLKELLQNTDFTKLSLIKNNHSYTVFRPDNMQLDFGALGKGYAADLTAELLSQKGIKSALLDFGGNIQAVGSKPDGSNWNVGIKSPWDLTVCASVKVCSKAVVTSGGYERFFVADDGKKYIHIINPQTGMPVNNGLASVTIITDSGLYADALSTALFVKGLDKAIEYWKNNQDFEMILMTDTKDFYYTSGLEENLNLIKIPGKVKIIKPL